MARVPGRVGEALEECGVVLQVALDHVNLLGALRIGLLLPRSRRLVIEAGTPLLKSSGMHSVRALRVLFPNNPIVADTKTMDAGSIEAGIVGRSGGDALTVLSHAPRETLEEVSIACNKLGLAVYGDLIGSSDPLSHAGKLKDANIHVALLHVGVDVQLRRGETAYESMRLLKELKEEFGGPVAVAGGIRPGMVAGLARSGADIIIIGSGITGVSNPRAEAEKALKLIEEVVGSCR